MASSSLSQEQSTTDIEQPESDPVNVNDIIQSLDELLDSMNKNHSVISQITEYWGKQPIWLKMGGGLATFGFFLIIGILTLSTLTVVATCFCAVLYTLISLGLDNHYTTNKNEHNRLKVRVLKLGSLLSSIIDKLESTCLKLSTEVDHLNDVAEKAKADFACETSKLKVEVDTSGQHNEALRNIVKSLTSHLTDQTVIANSLDRHLNEITAGKSEFIQALGNVCNLEKELSRLKTELGNCHQRNESLFNQYESLLNKYDRLVTQHQQKLENINKAPCSTGMQTEPTLCAERLLGGIITSVMNASDTNKFPCLSGCGTIQPPTSRGLSAGSKDLAL